MDAKPPLWKALGPGLLWAGTAIGVSHLVQSTRAGAGYGLALVGVVIAANVFKYPAFEAGPRYTAATGRSLLDGYARRGRWALWLFLALTVSTMFTVVAAVTIVAAGMMSALISDAIPTWGWSAVLFVLTAALLASGRFKVLERFMTAMMLVLTVSTVVSVLLVLPQTDWASLPLWPPIPPVEAGHMLFLAGLVGWMPSALDIAVWHSLWALDKQASEGVPLTPEGSRFDYDVGYVGTTVLAVMFVFLGASVLYGRGQVIPETAVGFAKLLVDAYTAVLGPWARPVLLVAAFSTMLSTTVAVTDGFPRALEGAIARIRGADAEPAERTRVYWGSLLLCAVVAQLIIAWFAGQLTFLIDFATGLTGVTAPVFALLNLAAVTGDEVPVHLRPSRAFLVFHIAGVVFLVAMAALYLFARFML